MVHEEVLSLAAQDRLVNLLGKDLPQGLKTFLSVQVPVCVE